MGGSVSTAVSKLQQATINETKSSGSASAQCNQTISNSNIEFGGSMGKDCKINVKNECTADASVAMESIIQAATKTLNEADAQTKGGFGLSASTTVSETESFVRNSLESSCDTEAKIDQSISQGIKVGGDCNAPIDIVNLGNAKANCMMTAAMDAINETMAETNSTGKGTSLLGAIGGPGMEGDPDYNNPMENKGKKGPSFISSYSSCCMCVCICALGGLGLAMSMGKKKKGLTPTSQSESESQSQPNDNLNMAKNTVGILGDLKNLIPGRRRGIRGGSNIISYDTLVGILSNKWVYLALVLLAMFLLLNVSESPLFNKQIETQETNDVDKSPPPQTLSASSKFDTPNTFL